MVTDRNGENGAESASRADKRLVGRYLYRSAAEGDGDGTAGFKPRAAEADLRAYMVAVRRWGAQDGGRGRCGGSGNGESNVGGAGCRP